MNDNEIPKYKKKKNSSTSKSATKSKHKHEYIECLFITNGHPHRGEYCKLCGKVGDWKICETERTEEGYYRVLDYDEVFELYKDLEQIYVEDMFQRYVSVSVRMEK